MKIASFRTIPLPRLPAFVLLVSLFTPLLPGADANIGTLAMMKRLSVEELMDLDVISVSKRPEKLSQTASAIQVVTGDEIHRSGATRLPEALRLASNLQVSQIDSRQWAVSSRGFNSNTGNKLLVLIDGRTIYTPLYSGVFWDAQEVFLEDLDRIEVISGPGATQWGANAVNGVINIVSKSARDTQGTLLYGGGGDELGGFGGARYGGTAAPGVYYRVYGQYSERDDSVLANNADAVDSWHLSQGGFRVDWEPAADRQLTLQGDAYDGRLAQPGNSDIAISGANLLSRWSRTLTPDSNLQLQLYFDRTHRRIPGSFAQDLDTYDLDFQHRLLLGERHDLVWGLGYRVVEDDVRNPITFAFLPANVIQDRFSAFAQDEIVLLPDRLHFALGAKIEHNDYTAWEFQPSARLSWHPTENHTVWSAVSRAVRTPSRIDRDFYAPRDPPHTQLVGGPDFDSETLIAYELGYRVHPFPQLALALATFYHDYDDLRSVEKLNPPNRFPFELANGQRGHSAGAELTVDYRATDRWRLRAGYTELRVHIEPKAGSNDTSQGSAESHDANHQFQLRSSLDLPAHFTFDTTLRYVAPISNQAVPEYTELDLRLAWQPTPTWEFSLVGQNLLHQDHVEFGTVGARREIERSIYGKVQCRF